MREATVMSNEPIRTNTNPTDVFRAVQHETRREILKMICDSRPHGTRFGSIWEHFKTIRDERTGKPKYSKPNISQHVRELVLAGLIIARKEGGYKRYFPSEEKLKIISAFAKSLQA